MHSHIRTYLRLYIGWVLIVLAHIAVYIGSIVAILFAIVNQPWYLSCLFALFYLSPALAGIFCVFTNAENYFRMSLGWEVIPDDAISFYFRKWKGSGTVDNIMFEE